MQSPVVFLRDVKEQIRKIMWPSKKETVMTALFVFVFVVVMAMFFLAVDNVYVRLIGLLMGW